VENHVGSDLVEHFGQSPSVAHVAEMVINSLSESEEFEHRRGAWDMVRIARYFGSEMVQPQGQP
jgi:hypothetical protein